jgi:hypothetical protein
MCNLPLNFSHVIVCRVRLPIWGIPQLVGPYTTIPIWVLPTCITNDVPNCIHMSICIYCIPICISYTNMRYLCTHYNPILIELIHIPCAKLEILLNPLHPYAI